MALYVFMHIAYCSRISEKTLKTHTNRDPEGVECEARQFVDDNGECQPRQDEGALSCLIDLSNMWYANNLSVLISNQSGF